MSGDGEFCDGCGHAQDECKCDRPVEGYECGKCGYVPTQRELNRGSCPGCRELRQTEEKTG